MYNLKSSQRASPMNAAANQHASDPRDEESSTGALPDLERRLCTIMVMDIVNYTGLMEADEVATHQRWMDIRAKLIEPQIGAHGGSLVKSTGDGLLVEFQSTIEAVQCAIEMQRDLAAANSSTPTRAPIQLRVSVHVGNVIPAGGDIYGDGVNVAVRLQEHADPGGIIVSARVQEQIEGTPGVVTEPVGLLRLKNLQRPVHAFRLRQSHSPPPPSRARTGTHPPSVAILPFRIQPEDSANEYFIEGVIDNIVSSVAGVPDLLVISRASTLPFKSSPAELRSIGHQLGARYIVVGTARRTRTHLALAPELTDTDSGRILWSNRYEVPLEKLFEVQDDVSRRIAQALVPNLRGAELKRISNKRPENFDAYDLTLQAMYGLYRLEPEGFNRALELLERAIEIDPGYANAYSLIARWYMMRIGQGHSRDAEADTATAMRYAAAAVERDPLDPIALAVYGHAKSWLLHEYDAALELFDQALSAGPNSAIAWAFSGPTHAYIGDGPTAVAHAEYAIRLSPLDPYAYYFRGILCFAHYVHGTYDEAVKWGRRTMAVNPKFTASLRFLAAALGALGRTDEAREVAQALLAVEPKFSSRRFCAMYSFREESRKNLLAAHLRAAGLPD